MNCEGLRDVLERGLHDTTVAERNAACEHHRGCKACKAFVIEQLRDTPPSLLVVVAAGLAMAKDKSDPEWK